MDNKGKLSDKIILIIVLIIVSVFAKGAVHTIMLHILPPPQSQAQQEEQQEPQIGIMQQYQFEKQQEAFMEQLEKDREAYQAANGQ